MLKVQRVIKQNATTYVTEFWKITLMGAPETIRIFNFITVLLTSEKHA